MQRKTLPAGAPARGRPPAKASKHVFQDIMDACEQALETKTPKEITTKDISSAAGSNEAMIGYYFGGKDGLLVAMLDDLMHHTSYSSAEEMSKRCLENRSIAPLVAELAQAWNSRPNLVRMIMAEFLQATSPIKKTFLERYARHTPAYVMSVIRALQTAQIYRSDVDARCAAFSLVSLILSPVSLSSAAEAMGFADGLVGNQRWIEYVAFTLDASCADR